MVKFIRLIPRKLEVYFFILPCILFSSISCGLDNKNIYITGDIKNIYSKTIFLRDVISQRIIDSSKVLNGNFKFKIPSNRQSDLGLVQLFFYDTLRYANEHGILFKNKYYPHGTKSNIFSPYFIVEPGNITISGTLLPFNSLSKGGDHVEITENQETSSLFEIESTNIISNKNIKLSKIEKIRLYQKIANKYPNSKILMYFLYNDRLLYNKSNLLTTYNLLSKSSQRSAFGNRLREFLEIK